jgi:hypothetical protein
VNGGPIKISGCVEGHAGIRVSSWRESTQYALRPISVRPRSELKDSATVAISATLRGRTVEIPRCIENEPGVGSCTILSACEEM